MLNIVIFGPPGAGKGTQSAKLIDKYNLIHLSTGDILRREIASGSILGQEAKFLMDQGRLVPDEIVITMINNKLQQNKNANGFIFDGFPRTIAQAEALDRLLNSKKIGITMTLALDISDDELISRIVRRGEESGRTDDLDMNTIRNRLSEYASKTAPLKNYYTKQKKYYPVKGVGTVEEIFNSLCTTIDSNYLPGQAFVPASAPERMNVPKKSAPAVKNEVPAKKKAAVKKAIPSKKKAVVKKAVPAKKKAPVKKSLPAKKLSAKKIPKKKPSRKKNQDDK